MKKKLEVEFIIQNANTKWGEYLCIVGNIAQLGSWNLSKAQELYTSEFPIWKTKNKLIITSAEEAKNIEYKYVVKQCNGSDEVN